MGVGRGSTGRIVMRQVMDLVGLAEQQQLLSLGLWLEWNGAWERLPTPSRRRPRTAVPTRGQNWPQNEESRR